MKTTAALAFASSLLLTSISAQEQYSIDPSSVSNSTRQAWCTSQLAQCPLICLQTAGNSAATESNTCDADSLTYSCVCSNGLSPNVTEYSQTLPYYICQEWGTECVSNCGSDSSCASNCRSQHPCGAQNPTRANSSTITSTMSKTNTASGQAGATTNSEGTVYTGFGGSAATGSAAAEASSGGAAGVRVAALNVGQTFGLLGLAGALFGGFAILL